MPTSSKSNSNNFSLCIALLICVGVDSLLLCGNGCAFFVWFVVVATMATFVSFVLYFMLIFVLGRVRLFKYFRPLFWFCLFSIFLGFWFFARLRYGASGFSPSLFMFGWHVFIPVLSCSLPFSTVLMLMK